jgi:UDP-N-acetylglucosamine transferase subunit ALG13
MILVVVGLHKQGFKRLIEKMDEISPNVDDEIIMQIGHTNFIPKNVKYFKFKSNEEIMNLYMSSDIVITHGGVGSIMTALKYGKKVISVPRLSKYGEHKNDHQLDIVDMFSKKGLIKVVYDVDDLLLEIYNVKNGTYDGTDYRFDEERSHLIMYLTNYLGKIKEIS